MTKDCAHEKLLRCFLWGLLCQLSSSTDTRFLTLSFSTFACRQ